LLRVSFLAPTIFENLYTPASISPFSKNETHFLTIIQKLFKRQKKKRYRPSVTVDTKLLSLYDETAGMTYEKRQTEYSKGRLFHFPSSLHVNWLERINIRSFSCFNISETKEHICSIPQNPTTVHKIPSRPGLLNIRFSPRCK